MPELHDYVALNASQASSCAALSNFTTSNALGGGIGSETDSGWVFLNDGRSIEGSLREYISMYASFDEMILKMAEGCGSF